jgi:magnesium-transporting ATPase (P-type)
MSDYPALKQADVSISSRSSCDVIKQNSSILLDEFDFEQFEAALMMGK